MSTGKSPCGTSKRNTWSTSSSGRAPAHAKGSFSPAGTGTSHPAQTALGTESLPNPVTLEMRDAALMCRVTGDFRVGSEYSHLTGPSLAPTVQSIEPPNPRDRPTRSVPSQTTFLDASTALSCPKCSPPHLPHGMGPSSGGGERGDKAQRLQATKGRSCEARSPVVVYAATAFSVEGEGQDERGEIGDLQTNCHVRIGCVPTFERSGTNRRPVRPRMTRGL